MVPEPRRPVNEPSFGFGPDIRLAIELDHVTLAIIEANGLHILEPVQGLGKTDRAVLATREQHQRPLVLQGKWFRYWATKSVLTSRA